MGYKEIAGSPLLYILVAVGLLYIIGFAALFLKKSFNRCVELGMEKAAVINVIKSSVVYSIVPSIAIVIGFFSLTTVLGIPWPWWRLSVIGSVSYELMAADMAAKGMGYVTTAEMLAANDPKVFGAMMIIMSLGMLGGFFVLIPFGKKITSGLMKARSNTNSTWGIVMNNAFMLTLAAVFIPFMLLGDPVQMATFLTSVLIALGISFLAKKLKAAWLSNFIMAITLILGMASSIVWTSILK
jgi:hypothetical protein